MTYHSYFGPRFSRPFLLMCSANQLFSKACEERRPAIMGPSISTLISQAVVRLENSPNAPLPSQSGAKWDCAEGGDFPWGVVRTLPVVVHKVYHHSLHTHLKGALSGCSKALRSQNPGFRDEGGRGGIFWPFILFYFSLWVLPILTCSYAKIQVCRISLQHVSLSGSTWQWSAANGGKNDFIMIALNSRNIFIFTYLKPLLTVIFFLQELLYYPLSYM